MTIEQYMEGNLLIAKFMEWEAHEIEDLDGKYTEYIAYNSRNTVSFCYIPCASNAELIARNFGVVQMVAEKVAAEVDTISLRVREYHGISWTAGIKPYPYRAVGAGKGATPAEALYKVIVNYLKKRK